MAVVRGLAVGLGVFVVTIWFIPVGFAAPLFILLFVVLYTHGGIQALFARIGGRRP